MKEDVLSRLREFIENEVRSGSMDFGCIANVNFRVTACQTL